MESKKLIESILYTLKSHLVESKVRLNIENDIELIDERSFEMLQDDYIENYDKMRSKIFVVLKLEKGTIQFGSVVQPATLICYSETESFDKARALLNDVATRFNFNLSNGENSDVFLQEVYTTSEMEDAFIEEGNNFRASFSINATFVYSENMSGITEITINNNAITFVSANAVGNISPNTANIGNNNGRTQTFNKFMSFNLTFAFPSRENEYLTQVCDGVLFGNTDLNIEYVVVIRKNGTNYTKRLKILSIDYEQNMGEIPAYAVAFGV